MAGGQVFQFVQLLVSKGFLCLQVSFFPDIVNLPCFWALLPQISLKREGNSFKSIVAGTLFQEEFSIGLIYTKERTSKIKTNHCNFFYSCSCQQLCMYRSRQNWGETAYIESTHWQGKFFLCMYAKQKNYTLSLPLSLKIQRNRFWQSMPEAQLRSNGEVKSNSVELFVAFGRPIKPFSLFLLLFAVHLMPLIYSCCSWVDSFFKIPVLVSFLLSVKQIVPKLYSLRWFKLKAVWQSYFFIVLTFSWQNFSFMIDTWTSFSISLYFLDYVACTKKYF